MKILFFIAVISSLYCQGQQADLTRFDNDSSKSNSFPDNTSNTQSSAALLATPESDYAVVRSSLGLAGTSKTINTQKGSYHVSESIGQRSVIGSFYKKGYTLRQGYQQPEIDVKVFNSPGIKNLEASFYPNPFLQSLNISIDTPVTGPVNIFLFDFTGRLVFNREYPASQFINLQLSNISQGVYIIKVASGGNYVSANLIKN